MISTARLAPNINDFALIAMLGLLGLRIFEACGASIDNLAEKHGHRVRKVRGKGGKTVLIPLPPAVGRAIDRAVDGRDAGPILHNAPVTFLIIPSRGSRSPGPVWLLPPVVRMIRGVLSPGRVASTDR
jgi:integrase